MEITDSITRPKVKHDTSGLIFSRGYWKVEYRRNGKQFYKSLRTKDKSEATRLRDEFYRELDAKGAATSGSQGRSVATSKVLADPSNSIQYISYRKPYLVKIQGIMVGSFETILEARAARNAFLDID